MITPTSLEKAEAIVKEHQSKGGLIIDEDTNKVIQSIEPDTVNVLLLDPLAGG